jgi:NADH-quinone oxidoreductase subunit L
LDDPIQAYLGPLFTGIASKWWVDEFYNALIVRPYLSLSRWLADIVDWQFWHDWFHDKVILAGYRMVTGLLAVQIDLGLIDAIANGLGKLTQSIASRLRRLQTGYVRDYALSVFLGVIVILGYLILR